VVVALAPANGAPVIPKVARSVMRPAPQLVKLWVAAFKRKSLWSERAPFSCVLVLAKLN